MIDIDVLEKLMGQSKEEYARFLENAESDVLSEAGELLWECLKADLAQVVVLKNDDINALMAAAAKMGEIYNQLFYQCYHFHSWYVGGVPNDFDWEKKLYLKTFKSLEKLIEKRGKKQTNKKRMETAVEAI